MQWKTRPLGYFSYTVLYCLCKRGDCGACGGLPALKISIHAPARGATAGRIWVFQSRTISIHAPARGATGLKKPAFTPLEISIHAPARGATRRQEVKVSASAYFNSRPCERGDALPPCGGPLIRPATRISIHAPARGATSSYRAAGHWMRRFQFTPLREGRRPLWGGCGPPRYFNSRPCERGDAMSPTPSWGPRLFQFTPLREGRQQNQTKYALFFLQL